MELSRISIILLLLSFAVIYCNGSNEMNSQLGEDGEKIDCTSCGNECHGKCGTWLFRTCCFHFTKKRNNAMPSLKDLITMKPRASEKRLVPKRMKQLWSTLKPNGAILREQEQEAEDRIFQRYGIPSTAEISNYVSTCCKPLFENKK